MVNVWLLRANAGKKLNKDILNKLKTDKVIAIGWGETGDLTGLSKIEIKKEIGAAYKDQDVVGTALGNAQSLVNIFVNEMEIGDFVIVPNGEEIHLATITGPYFYNDSPDVEFYPHMRQVKWEQIVRRSDVSEKLRRSLRVMRTAANLTKHYDEVSCLISGEKCDIKPRDIDVSYPLRSDFIIKFTVPADMTENEAKRFSTYISTLYFE